MVIQVLNSWLDSQLVVKTLKSLGHEMSVVYF